jgi:hypothetical protein
MEDINATKIMGLFIPPKGLCKNFLGEENKISHDESTKTLE